MAMDPTQQGNDDSLHSPGSMKSSTLSMRRYRQKLKQNPEMCREYRARQLAHQKRYMARKKQRIVALASALAVYGSSHGEPAMNNPQAGQTSFQPDPDPNRG
ncbi:hypothetical protein ACOMHN_022982 [Nucella lapillus]